MIWIHHNSDIYDILMSFQLDHWTNILLCMSVWSDEWRSDCEVTTTRVILTSMATSPGDKSSTDRCRPIWGTSYYLGKLIISASSKGRVLCHAKSCETNTGSRFSSLSPETSKKGVQCVARRSVTMPLSNGWDQTEIADFVEVYQDVLLI